MTDIYPTLAEQARLPLEILRTFCHRNHIAELAVFGSALGGNFNTDSDLDVLVTFEADADWGIFDIARMQNKLSDLVGRPVNLVERSAVEESRNPIRHREILDTAYTVYAA
ncbi:MAG TPA: nucleotidyltransferase domain-containing protein [Thermomicrobiales bacterium]|nr:nucleotidyltransferase domain-containing protein [Thermomicrobiales bacterium]